jgi:CTP:molybdopterin cytidylyltransferase MocA
MSAASSRLIGVILAAGRGGRMGGKKQLKPWRTADGEKPLIAAAYDAVHPICDEMVLVLGHAADEVAAALGDRAFHRVESDEAAPMFESIRTGLRAAQQIDATATVVLQPGDHPEVSAATLRELTDNSRTRQMQAIIPQLDDCGGHPVFIPPNISQILIDADCPHGLAQFWLDYPELCYRVSVDDPTVVRDIDTPADLQ